MLMSLISCSFVGGTTGGWSAGADSCMLQLAVVLKQPSTLPHCCAGGTTVLALRSKVSGESVTVEHLQNMLALFGSVSSGQLVDLPEPEASSLEAYAFEFSCAAHAAQATQVRCLPGAGHSYQCTSHSRRVQLFCCSAPC
jgi:hypothetical protein